MAGTQAPKGFGILFVLVGIPLILWEAFEASRELNAVYERSDTPNARIEWCAAKAAEAIPDPTIRRYVCKCVDDKATARGAFDKPGGIDKNLLASAVDECLSGG